MKSEKLVWCWIDKDGNPAMPGEYLVAVNGRVRVLWWDLEAWKTAQYMAAYSGEVVAWTPLPAFPEKKP